MNQPTDFALDEAREDIRTAHDWLRDALPVLITLAVQDSGWPDTLLGDVAVTLAQSICRLEAATGLLTEGEGSAP